VKVRTNVTHGAGSPAAALAMVFKLTESAQDRWRAIAAPHLVVLVRAGARFMRTVTSSNAQRPLRHKQPDLPSSTLQLPG
jgi:hypothetical protein